MTGGLPLNLIHFLILQVLIAVGRDACTDKIGLDKAGVKVNPKYVYHLIVFFFFFSLSFLHAAIPSDWAACSFKTRGTVTVIQQLLPSHGSLRGGVCVSALGDLVAREEGGCLVASMTTLTVSAA